MSSASVCEARITSQIAGSGQGNELGMDEDEGDERRKQGPSTTSPPPYSAPSVRIVEVHDGILRSQVSDDGNWTGGHVSCLEEELSVIRSVPPRCREKKTQRPTSKANGYGVHRANLSSKVADIRMEECNSEEDVGDYEADSPETCQHTTGGGRNNAVLHLSAPFVSDDLRDLGHSPKGYVAGAVQSATRNSQVEELENIDYGTQRHQLTRTSSGTLPTRASAQEDPRTRPYHNPLGGEHSADPAQRLHSTVELISYQWNRINSCYVDHTTEIWFRHWSDWNQHEQTLLVSMLNQESFLSQGLAGRVVMDNLVAELKRGQAGILRYCEEVWGGANFKGEYHCATSWIQSAVRDMNPPIEVQAHFGIRHTIFRRCSADHTANDESPLPLIHVGIEQCIVTALRDLYPGQLQLTPEHYFRHYFPRTRSHTFVHKDAHPVPCRHPRCSHSSTIRSVQITWPKMLTCATIANAPTELHPTTLQWPKSFDIVDPHNGLCVQYSLKGCVLYGAGHFTATEISVGGEDWAYNDINEQQQEGRSGPGFSALVPMSEARSSGSRPHHYVYMRTSHEAIVSDCPWYLHHKVNISASRQTHRNLEDIQRDGECLDKVYARIGIHTKDPLYYDDEGNEVTADQLLDTHIEQAKQASAQDLVTAIASTSAPSASGGGIHAPTELDEAKEGTEGEASLIISPPPLTLGREGKVAFLESCAATSPPLAPHPPLSAPAPYCGPHICAALDGQDGGPPLVQCIFCGHKWHQTCVVAWDSEKIGRTAARIEKLGFKDFVKWCCPNCLAAEISPWDELLIGRFILADIRPHAAAAPQSPLYYPAKICDRRGQTVHLVWFNGNMYPNPDQRPTSPFFTMNANDCLLAHQSPFHAVGEASKQGTIAIPPSLDQDSTDRGIKSCDATLLAALHQASGEFISIVQGRKPHILWALYDDYWQYRGNGTPQKQLRSAYLFSLDFDFPIFPAHDATALLFARYFRDIARDTARASNVHIAIVHEIATVFFRTIVARHHLGTTPSNDPLISLLAFRGVTPPTSNFHRRLSPIEREALEGRLIREPSDYELAAKVPSGRLHRTIQPHLASTFTSAVSPIRAELPDSQVFPFPPGIVSKPQSFERLPPLPMEFRESNLHASSSGPGPRSRPTQTTEKRRAPAIVTLLDSSPVWLLLPPLLECRTGNPTGEASVADSMQCR
ncbi:hypothetical protein NMY22_g17175 [Coprinellus aureogranulatus]|nr:hypothetical protein NMY22_g17175 [Coprinellus aureogranulatus]